MEKKKKEFGSANVLSVEVGTTGYCGGDAGHGAKTAFEITDEAGTAWEARITYQNGVTVVFEDPKKVEIVALGDCEAETFTDALKFAGDTLSEALTGKDEVSRSELAFVIVGLFPELSWKTKKVENIGILQDEFIVGIETQEGTVTFKFDIGIWDGFEDIQEVEKCSLSEYKNVWKNWINLFTL
ncbi:MAG: hypothetical protein EOM48_13255 [Bacilli bacterium]|nr:hypothetical protein [Bacilli bacterium]